MKNKLIWAGVVTIGLLLRAAGAGAQAPTWAWAATVGADSNASATVVDSAGNVYVTGSFWGTATFGATTLTSAGENDIFVARLTPAGTYAWVVQAGGAGAEDSRGIALDRHGNLSITGYFFSPTIDFGPTRLVNHGADTTNDVFVAQLSPAGAWQWATSAGGADGDDCFGIVADAAGQLYVTGYFSSASAQFGATTLTTPGLFVARLTSAGAWSWATAAPGAQGRALAVDPAGYVYVTGGIGSLASFGTIPLVSSGGSDAFVARMTTSGTWDWAVRLGGPSTDDGRGLALDAAGNVYVTGIFWGDELRTGTSTLYLPPNNTFNAFVARLSPAHQWQWAAAAYSGAPTYASGIKLRPTGELLVSGNFEGAVATFDPLTLANTPGAPRRSSDLFIAQISPAGAWQRVTAAPNPGNEYCAALALGLGGQVVVAGTFAGTTATFGPTTLTNPNGVQALVAQLGLSTGLAPAEAVAGPLLSFAPNPAHRAVRLLSTPAGVTTATLLDGLGRVVRTYHLRSETSHLDLTGLPAGLYTVRAGTHARRLVVEQE